MFKKSLLSSVLALGMLVVGSQFVTAQTNPNDLPGIQEPVLSELMGMPVSIPNTDQVTGDVQNNVVGAILSTDALGEISLMGHPITHVSSPNVDMEQALQDLKDAAKDGDDMIAAANELKSILLGTTVGKIYDGFAMLNYNRGAFAPDHIPNEYKMKWLTDSGQTAPGIDGNPRKIWEVDVNMLWYDGNFDCDTFMLRIPVAAHDFDMLRVNYRIYSLVREEFAPTTVMTDKPTSVKFPFKGLDSVWIQVGWDSVTEITVDHPPLQMLRGIYTWGWRVHPPRIHFLQPVSEIVNAHTGNIELDPQGKSFADRNRGLTIAGIGDAAPEKKMYNVCMAVLGGADSEDVLDMLTDWQYWADLAKDQLQLPPEAWTVAGLQPGNFGQYRFVTVFLNNEMYGDGPDGGGKMEEFAQGESIKIKVINLDNHTHYYRNVDFGPKLHDDLAGVGNAGSHSFEIFNFKPVYGAPKVAEMQWRAGWGFRPHFNVIQQQDVFPRSEDQGLLEAYVDGEGNERLGYQYSTGARGGDFRFNPPPFIIGQSFANPSSQLLNESDGSNGLVIGQTTEGYGVAKMCPGAPGGFCPPIDPTFNPNGTLNFPPPPAMMGPPTMLRFPPFLRNPNPNGGDIIPPTPIWKPFLWINPSNGTLLNVAGDPSQGYWADQTYSHGTPVVANGMITATIESPRASGQIFYQFDDLFHDNAIFSPHTFLPRVR